MAKETTSPTTATETSPMVEEESPTKQTDAPKEKEVEEATEISAETKEISAETKEIEAKTKEIEAETKEIDSLSSDHKRKLEDLEGDEGDKKTDEPDLESNEKKDVSEVKTDGDDGLIDAKRQRVDGDAEGLDGSQDIQKEAQPIGNGQLPHSENIESGSVDTFQNSTEGVSQEAVLPYAVHQDTAQNSMEGVHRQITLSSAGQHDTSRKMEVPNNKVGVLIGKSGETIRLLQYNSGAKIQIARDADVNPISSTRPVELIGTLENINKAEQLIKDVIAEAEAGGSPALVARGFSATQSGSGSEVHEMQVPNEKVGWIIGKGGETIKNLQTRSHARIQLIPQHLPGGDFSTERTVRITGNKKQIEAAKTMINDVMIQSGRQSNPSSGYRPPRGRSSQSQWGPRPQVQSQMAPNTGYNYPQRGGTYQQPYYQQQPPQRPATETPHGGGGYDYYGQQGQAMATQVPSYPSSAPTSAPVNYNNYGQPQPAVGGYGHQANPQQSYGGYDNQAAYNQQQQQQQQGGYYSQQPPPSYGSKPPPTQSAYGPPTNQGPTTQQQPYPYGTTPAPAAQPAAYGQGYGPAATDGYNQAPPSTTAAAGGGYSQPTSYGQGYNAHPGGAGGYGQYPQQAAQPPAAAAAYVDQSVTPANNVNYGYQAAPGYGTQLGYGGYAQAPAAAANYDQAAVGYCAAPVGYAKGVSPQPAGAAPYGGGGSQY